VVAALAAWRGLLFSVNFACLLKARELSVCIRLARSTKLSLNFCNGADATSGLLPCDHQLPGSAHTYCSLGLPCSFKLSTGLIVLALVTLTLIIGGAVLACTHSQLLRPNGA
jgi:hypothetical protein